MELIKNENDIAGIKQCCRIVAEVLNSLYDYVRPGITTEEIASFADKIIRRNGASSAFKNYQVPGLVPFPGVVCTSINSGIVHGIPSATMNLKEGDIIGVDVGVTLNGYYGDAARTYAVGDIDKQAAKLLKVTRKSLYKGIEQARDGLKVGDISYAIGSYIKRKGFYVADHLTGHGVGKSLHEPPMIPNTGYKGTGSKLIKGMTIAIEPMVNVGTNRVKENGWEFFSADNSLSAHFEHTVLITENEPEILTK